MKGPKGDPKAEERMVGEALLKLAREQFLPGLKLLNLTPKEQEIIKELEDGKIKASDSVKVGQIRQIYVKYHDQIAENLKTAKQRKEFEKFMENIKEFRAIIETERELLEVLKPYEDKWIKIDTGDYLLKFKVKPIEPGDDLSVMNVDEHIMSELSAYERNLLARGTSGNLKSEQEEEKYLEIVSKMEQQRIANLAKEIEKTANFLGTFLSPPEDKAKAVEFWKRQNIAMQTIALTRTLEALGLAGRSVERLFQVNKIARI